MATPSSATLPVSCPDCGARFQVGAELAGKKGRCAKCGSVFRVPATATRPMGGLSDADSASAKRKNSASERPPKTKNDDSIPQHIRVYCRVCQTMMYGRPEEIGHKIKCPDCFKVIVVPQPTVHKPVPSVLSRDEDDILIDPTLDPGERAPVIIPPRRPMLYEEEAEAAQKRQEEKLARGERVGTMYDRAGRPIMPRWPMATRILPFLFSRGVPVRWIIFSVGAMLGLTIGLYGLSIAMAGGFAAIGGMCFVAMGIMIMAIWFGGFAATIFTIITESSEGNESIEQWPPPVVTEWFGEAFTLIFAILVSPIFGWLAARFVPGDQGLRNLLFLGSSVIFLPVIILSQLDLGSMFGIASARVFASVVRLPASWLLFYFEIALLMAICMGATLAAERIPFLALVLVPLYVAAAILAARILGRLAWKLAESTEERDAMSSK